jgi:hypothetical protein
MQMNRHRPAQASRGVAVIRIIDRTLINAETFARNRPACAFRFSSVHGDT